MEDQKYKSEMLQETKEQTRLIEKIYNNVLFFLFLTVTSIVASAIILAMVLSKPANIDETSTVGVETPNVETTAPADVKAADVAADAVVEERMGADVQAKAESPATEAKAASKPAVDAGVPAPTAVPSSLNKKSLEEDPSLK